MIIQQGHALCLLVHSTRGPLHQLSTTKLSTNQQDQFSVRNETYLTMFKTNLGTDKMTKITQNCCTIHCSKTTVRHLLTMQLRQCQTTHATENLTL